VESGYYLTSKAVCELVYTRDGVSDTPTINLMSICLIFMMR